MSKIGPVNCANFIHVAEVLGLPVPDFETSEKAFIFRRRKRGGVWGWTTWLRIGKLTLGDLPWADGIPFPRRLAVAKRWAFDFAERNGFHATVDAPRRRPRLRLIMGGKR